MVRRDESVWVCLLCIISLVFHLQRAEAIEAGGLRALLRSRFSSSHLRTPPRTDASVKVDQAAVCYSLKQVFKHEGMVCVNDVAETSADFLCDGVQTGKCGNHASDSGNKCKGKIGWTCMGVTPCNVWNARKTFYKHCLSKCTVDWEYSKCCYDMDTAAYQVATEKYYVEKYFTDGNCLGLGWPAFYVCGDIAINSGIGRSQQYVGLMGSTCDTYPGGCKAYCTAMNQKHRVFYHEAAKKNDNHKFLAGASQVRITWLLCSALRFLSHASIMQAG